MLLGHTCVCAVEIEPYRRAILLQRQRDGILPRFPVWDDIRTFDGRPWSGRVEVVCGGFPCQDISAAGKGVGIDGSRSGLWREMVRVVREVGPRYVFVENSPVLTARGLGRVLGDLAETGYDAKWDVFGADDVGAPHHRKRLWILAHAQGDGRRSRVSEAISIHSASCGDRDGQSRRGGGGIHAPVAHADEARLAEREGVASDPGQEQPAVVRDGWWSAEPDVGRVAHGVAHRVDRIASLGDGQVPAVAALAWRVLLERDGAQGGGIRQTRCVTVVPIRSKEYLSVWERALVRAD